MMLRREFLAAGAATAAAGPLAAARTAFRIGVTDWNLRKSAEIEAVALAASLGFEGVEISLGRKPEGGKLQLDNAEIQAKYRAEAKRQKIRLAGTCLDVLHVNYLKNDKLGQKWVADGIQITKNLDAKVMLMPFFGKGALTTKEEMDYVGDLLRELGREAEKAKVMLGLEDTISAEDNVRIMDRSRSKAVKTYYDVGNSLNAGFDIFKEMNWLGGKRICQIHLKDKGYLGDGKIDFALVLKTIRDIGFQGFLNLETSSPSKSIEADMKRNLTFIRRLLA